MRPKIKKPNMNSQALYVHLPFCRKFCPYCDYPKTLYSQKREAEYLAALLMDLADQKIPPHSLKTIYLGGGTPNAWSHAGLFHLLKTLKPLLDCTQNYEWTIELNPELIDAQLLVGLKEHGVNRLSIGVQTFNDVQLKALGRQINTAALIETITLVKQHFANFSIDLIYGLPLDKEVDLRKNLEYLVSLDIPHFSLYPLSVHPLTKYGRDQVPEMDDEQYVRYTSLINDFARISGYQHYEVTNYAKSSKYYGQHNLTYWRAQPYFAIGMGAHGFINGSRYVKTRNYQNYLSAPTAASRTKVESYYEEYVMLNLRLATGIIIADFIDLFGTDLYQELYTKIYRLGLDECFDIDDLHLAVREDSFNILDYIIKRILL